MKKILMALTMIGLTYCSAEGQTDGKKTCETTQTKVCRKGGDCYKTKYAENFKVCKGDYGYFICCEAAGYSNATHPRIPMIAANQQQQQATYYPMQQEAYAVQDEAADMQGAATAPQSQSYPADYSVNRTKTYEGYYAPKGKVRVCYVGDNVAAENRAPYEGCPSPQDDGPERNRERNVNVVSQ